MKLIAINGGRHMVKVDDEDYDWLNDLKGWWTQSRGVVQLRKRGGKWTALMSRLITLPWADEVVRHRDGDFLNMQRANLEVLHISEARQQTALKSAKVRQSRHYWKHKTGGYLVSAQRQGQHLHAWAKTEEKAKEKARQFEKELGITN